MHQLRCLGLIRNQAELAEQLAAACDVTAATNQIVAESAGRLPVDLAAECCLHIQTALAALTATRAILSSNDYSQRDCSPGNAPAGGGS